MLDDAGVVFKKMIFFPEMGITCGALTFICGKYLSAMVRSGYLRCFDARSEQRLSS